MPKRKKKSGSGEQQVEVAKISTSDDDITVVLLPGEKEQIVGLAFRFCIEENQERGSMRAMQVYKRLWGKLLGVQQRMKARADYRLTKRSVERKAKKLTKSIDHPVVVAEKTKSVKKEP